MFPACSPW